MNSRLYRPINQGSIPPCTFALLGNTERTPGFAAAWAGSPPATAARAAGAARRTCASRTTEEAVMERVISSRLWTSKSGTVNAKSRVSVVWQRALGLSASVGARLSLEPINQRDATPGSARSE